MRLGIDLGGTKIEIIVLDSKGSEVFRKREPTPSGDYPAVLKVIKKLVDDATKEIKVSPDVGVGIGTPGALNPKDGLIQNSNSTCLIQKPLNKDLEKILNRPVRLSNDANCFALSEAVDGAGKGQKVVFGVILGTGVGGGIVVNKDILTGPNAISGEWGHNPLPWPQIEFSNDEYPGPNCYCGKSGCIEVFLSGPGMTSDHMKTTGQTLSAEEIAAAAEKGDAEASETLNRYELRLAKALSGVVNILDPDVIVLGGGVSNIERVYTNVPKLWSDFIFSRTVSTKLVRAKFGDSSGVRGAAWLWPTE